MIRTKYKSKPYSGLTHSIGAKQISYLLYGVRIYDELVLSFHKEKGQRMGLFVPGWSGRYMKGDSSDLLGFEKVISISYSSPLDQWIISIQAIEIVNNKKIKSFLIETGIRLLRNWLEAEKTDTWFSGYRHYQIGLNEKITEYCIWETHNDRTIKKKIKKIT